MFLPTKIIPACFSNECNRHNTLLFLTIVSTMYACLVALLVKTLRSVRILLILGSTNGLMHESCVTITIGGKKDSELYQ